MRHLRPSEIPPPRSRNMSESLRDPVDIYLTTVHNMHLRMYRTLVGWWPACGVRCLGSPPSRSASSWPRAAGCTSGGASPGGSAPSTNGIGPITLAIGKDNSWLAAGRDHRVEQAISQPEGHPAAAARGIQRPVGRAGGEPPGQERRVRRHRHGRHLDRGVRLERLDHPAAREPVPAEGFPQAGRRHRHVPGPSVRRTRLQQRGPALLPQGHPRQGGPAAAQDLGPAGRARRDRGPEVRAGRVRRHVRPV